MSKTLENQIENELLKHNINLHVKILCKELDIKDKTFEDVYDSFLLKYSSEYKVLESIYNKMYPYDLEVRSKEDVASLFKSCDIDYIVKNDEFNGIKFKKNCNEEVLEILMRHNVSIKGFFINIKYDTNVLMRFIRKLKLNLEYKLYTDGISNIFITTEEKNIVVYKLIIYEVYKYLKGPKELSDTKIFTEKHQIILLNNKFLNNFYERYFTKDVSDISFCIREYLDRNGFLIFFSIHTVDFLAYLILLKSTKMKSVTNILRIFLQFKFDGFNLKINKNEFSHNFDKSIIAQIDNLKYISRYPNIDVLNRLKYLNKIVYNKYYSDLSTSYYKMHINSINDKLNFVYYSDYDLVLSGQYISGSKKIEYQNKKQGNIFSFTDKRCYISYSKINNLLLVKFKETFNFKIFVMYLLSVSNFKYLLINKQF